MYMTWSHDCAAFTHLAFMLILYRAALPSGNLTIYVRVKMKVFDAIAPFLILLNSILKSGVPLFPERKKFMRRGC